MHAFVLRRESRRRDNFNNGRTIAKSKALHRIESLKLPVYGPEPFLPSGEGNSVAMTVDVEEMCEAVRDVYFRKWGCGDSVFMQASIDAVSEADGKGLTFDFESLRRALECQKKTNVLDTNGVCMDVVKYFVYAFRDDGVRMFNAVSTSNGMISSLTVSGHASGKCKSPCLPEKHV